MHRKLGVTIGVATALTVLPVARPAGQTPAPQSGAPQVTFRASSDIVEVDAFITDKDGNFVRDLTKDDFEVLEDGKPQVVDTFTLVDLPIGQTPPPPPRGEDYIEPGYISNEGGVEGRIYLIVLDSNHISPLRLPKVKDVVRQFILDNIQGNDKAAIVHVGRSDVGQDFTSNKRLLIDSLEKVQGDKLRSPALNKLDDLVRLGGTSSGLGGAIRDPRDMDAQQRAVMARETFDSLSALASYMAGIRGRRKALLFVSEGLDQDLNDVIGHRPSADPLPLTGTPNIDTEVFGNNPIEAALAEQTVEQQRLMVEAATRGNVAIYTVDPRGLADISQDSIEFQAPGPEILGGSNETATMLPTSALRRELRDSQQGLRSYAEQTGGQAIVGTNNFEDGFKRIVEDNSTYYVLGYATQPKYDGKFHEITVRVKRPGVTIRSRKGYYALKAPPVASVDVLHDLLVSPMAMPGLPMRASSTVLRGAEGQGLVQFTVEFPKDALSFEDKGNAFANRVDLSYLATDTEGNTKKTGSKILDMVLKPEGHDAAEAHGIRFATEMPLPPGRYQIRLAAKESVGARAGSIFWDVTVPDFSAERLTMSDLVLSSAMGGAAPTVHDAATLKAMLSVPPTVGRVFSLDDTLTVFSEVYDRDTEAHDVQLKVSVQMDDGTEVWSDDQARESSTRNAERGSYAYSARVPLQDLAPGRFTLVVEATSSLGPTAKRELQFRIE
ncbi:MAG: VWA domain-containing protein [Vicinamibacterales bacterium]